MEAKLKALKVVELRDVLQRANVTIPAKANKPDLIAKIASTRAAIDVFESLHGNGAAGTPTMKPAASKPAATHAPPPQTAPTTTINRDNSELLAPPEEIDWSVAGTATSPTSKYGQKSKSVDQKPVSTKPPSKTTAAPKFVNENSAIEATPAAAEVEEDEEAIKRRKRAERFGIPLVEIKKPAPTQKNARPGAAANGKLANNIMIPITEDPEKIKTRAERFGQTVVPIRNETFVAVAGAETKGNKRLPAEEVDAEEQERRRKRAERFGLKV